MGIENFIHYSINQAFLPLLNHSPTSGSLHSCHFILFTLVRMPYYFCMENSYLSYKTQSSHIISSFSTAYHPFIKALITWPASLMGINLTYKLK